MQGKVKKGNDLMRKCTVGKFYEALVYASVFSYVFYAVVSIMTKKQVLWTYASAGINVPIIGSYFVYLKDILAVTLFMILFQKKAKLSKEMAEFCGMIMYGIVILLINGTFNVLYIAAGFRSFLYFIVAIMVAKELALKYEINEVFKNLNRMMVTLILLETIVVLLQIAEMNIWTSIGRGGYRLCGTFGNAAAMGAFCIAASFVMMINSIKYGLISWNAVLSGGMCFFLSVTSGSRMSMMLVGITYLVIVNEFLGKVTRIKRKQRIFVLLCLVVLLAFPLYMNMIEHTGRGNLMVSGSTRLKILNSFFENSNLVHLLFGQGLGYGTNAAVNMGVEGSEILDGTINTILAQFGLLGIVVFLVLSIKEFRVFYFANKENEIITAIAILDYLVICITINLFEQVAFNAVAVVSFFLFNYMYLYKNRNNCKSANDFA